ncbi:hypothetical protein EDB81DRAFT_784448 [Dactylonectria macrodidyma]|uniref:DUF4267 domain-containing protein n=1 Tax=Dactylonectria macrodidyma TaxID=307937 RepID=A0A9P9FH03_9HYPO|nr:hypothetical protein EDB81DRAFT_784448 [Dactylonectria macrodidyma]
MTSISAWNTLGLGVAATWAALGLVGVLRPTRSAEIFGVLSMHKADGTPDDTGIALLFGSRDFTIAAALFALYSAGRDEEMGTVILSSMIICVADIYLAWKSRRGSEMLLFTVGASIWGIIGLGLKGFFTE